MNSFREAILTHISNLNQISNSVNDTFAEICMDTKRFRKGKRSGAEIFFKPMKGNLEVNGGEYCTNSWTETVKHWEIQKENFSLNPISITTIVNNFSTR